MVTYRYIFGFIAFFLLLPGSKAIGGTPAYAPTVTVLCYLNGDNDLSQEVLHALDMMETVGSSPQVNVIALVDGNPQWLQPRHQQWGPARLLHLQADPAFSVINSTVLEEWGEADLGSPDTLERFVRTALRRYPAQRYIFYTFAHSQGIIDTQSLTPRHPGKTLSISQDNTNQTQMRLDQFHGAIKRGLNGRTFDLMVLFSCLANMVEVGYAFSDITHYLVGSQDEIRLLNQPPGSHQIRGLPFEQVLAALHAAPDASTRILGEKMVDAHVNSYRRDVAFTSEEGQQQICRFSGGMALIDCSAMPPLVAKISKMTQLLMKYATDGRVVRAMDDALSQTQQFASFMNLEYYDFQRFIENLTGKISRPDLRQACHAVLDTLMADVVLYEQHTSENDATGMSVYLSSPLVPENIYRTHQAMYERTRFSRDTQWGKMIHTYRQRLRKQNLEIQ